MRHLVFSVVTVAAFLLPINAYAIYCPPKVIPAANYSGGNGFAFGIIGCAAGVVAAALVKNAAGKGELTAFEAATCGLGTLFSKP